MHDFNPDEFKAGQRQDWNHVSAGWEQWWETLEQGAAHISQHLLDLAQIAPGHQVLDIATGIGEPAVSAARRTGPHGRVVATDQAADMLAIARRRAAAEGLTNIEFLEGDGETLQLGDSSFDAVLCRWGLMFFPDPALALRSILAHLKPGGRLAAAVWSTPDKVPSISLPMNIVRSMLDLPPPDSGLPSPFCLADQERLEQLLQQAGFTDISIGPAPVTFVMPSAQAYTRFTLDVSAPLVKLLEGLPAAQRDAVIAAITDKVAELATDGGRIELEGEAICIGGRRPAP